MSAARLHPDDVDAIALRVAELLRPAAGEYLTVEEYALRFGVAESTVYAHKDDLGAIRIGGVVRLPAAPPRPPEPAPPPHAQAPRRPPRAPRARVELLPVAPARREAGAC